MIRTIVTTEFTVVELVVVTYLSLLMLYCLKSMLSLNVVTSRKFSANFRIFFVPVDSLYANGLALSSCTFFAK